ncbi:MAG: NAD-dependent deacylase [Bacteroidota bacterium]
MKQKLIVLTGAGMSAESGVRTFRDSDGLWEEHRVEDVATPEAFARNPKLVMRFYNQRRAQLKTVRPNRGHQLLAELEAYFDVRIITQNIDNLHERAGSSQIVHLHGELTKVRSIHNPQLIYDWPGDLALTDTNEQGHPLRPHIVWFGEQVPMLEVAANLVAQANIVVIIGTSMQVYPAAGLVEYAPLQAPVYYIDPKPNVNNELSRRRELHLIQKGASEGVAELRELLLE